VPKLPGEYPAAPLPNGTATDIVALFEKVATVSGGSATAGVLLVSDGRHNLPTDVVPVAQALGRAGVPIYTVGLGQDATPGDFKDVSIKQLIVPEKAFVGGRTILRVDIESTLKTPHTVPLTVEVDGKKILKPISSRTRQQPPIPGGRSSLYPDTLGLHRAVATGARFPTNLTCSITPRRRSFASSHEDRGVVRRRRAAPRVR